MRTIAVILLLFPYLIFSQTDWVKWEAKQISYEQRRAVIPSSSANGLGTKLASGLQKVYKFFISDLDGDNCPFYPSCSTFFVESVNEAGLIKGSLMFADRFIRDLNFFKGSNDYPEHISGKYYDPAYNYTLISQKIKYFTGDSVVKE